MIVEWFVKPMWVAQVHHNGLQYAFLSKDNKQCGKFVYCKEFLIDSVWAQIHKIPIELYGFLYDPTKDPEVCLDSCRILLRNPDDPNFEKSIHQSLKFLNLLEDQLQFPMSELVCCENAKFPTYALIGFNGWLHAPPLLSLYTLMPRVGLSYNGKDTFWKHLRKVCNHIVCPGQNEDGLYLKLAWNAIKDIIEGRYKKRFNEVMEMNYPNTGKQWHFHEYSGIVSLATGKAKYVFPEWFSS